MKVIGLTGGMGSGKSTVARVFKSLQIPIYEADDAAKKLYRTDQKLKNEVIRLLGPESYLGNTLNRKYVASKIFSNELLKKQLSSIVHPAVARDFSEWKTIVSKHQPPYILRVAAILFESKSNIDCDKVITVGADQNIRIERTIKRDQSTKEQVLLRMKSQLSDDERRQLSDFEIINQRGSMIIPQVLDIHRKLLS